MAVSAVSSARHAAKPSSDSGETYTIRHGDTLSGIAERKGVPLSALKAANPQVHNPDVIYPGERLTIPARGGNADSATHAASVAQPRAASAGKPASGFNISQRGVDMIEGFEGYSAHAYPDPGTGGAPWTIGYGHTAGVHRGDVITRAQAETFLKQDLGWAQRAVRDHVRVPINQNQFDALVSLTYNLGGNGYPGLLSKLNAGDYTGAKRMFGEYVHAGGHVLQGLVNRRAKEAALFGSGAPASGTPSTGGGTGGTQAPSGSGNASTYTVRSGDTLSGIAQRLRVSLGALEKANPQVANPDLIHPGQRLHLPGHASGGASPSNSGACNYAVHSGDTLSQIAERHGVSLRSLLSNNPQIHNPNLIHPGQTVHLQGGTGGGSASTPAPAQSHGYTVRAGDTLSGIAAHERVPLSALLRANPSIHDPDLIRVGQHLTVPGAGATNGPSDVSNNPSSTSGKRGDRVASLARSFVGEWAGNLKHGSRLPMNPNVPNTICCANFVSAVLQKAGALNVHTDLVSGSSRDGRGVTGSIGQILKARGWKVVDAAHARAGDVAIVNDGHHTELVSSNRNGRITLVGSNNTGGGSGPQRISYSVPYGNAWYLSPR